MITSRDPSRSQELQDEIKHYTDVANSMDDEGFVVGMERVLQDMYDTPFGGIGEVIHEDDDPDKPVEKVVHIDSATMFPTFNPDWPVGQRISGVDIEPVYYPKHAVSRIYMSPRTEFLRRGWGMAPPEKIYLALELLSRGDRYYANLLIDSPEAGILDLGDMAEESAKDWLEAWKNLLNGVDPYKVPVLYEHNSEAKYISFTRNPAELMYDKAVARCTMITTGGYGITPNDIGDSQGAAGTLAGSIRQERHSKTTGFGYARIKVKAFWDKVLPSYLVFTFIDRDEELLVAKGRARLASSLALSKLVELGVITKETAAAQLQLDGLITITNDVALSQIQEPVPDPKQLTRQVLGKNQVPPSQGGEGAISNRMIEQAGPPQLDRISRAAILGLTDYIKGCKEVLTAPELAVLRSALSGHFAAPVSGLEDLSMIMEPLLDRLNKLVSVDVWYRPSIDVEEQVSRSGALLKSYLTERGLAVSVEIPVQPLVKELIDSLTADVGKFLVGAVFECAVRSMQGESIEGDVSLTASLLHERVKEEFPRLVEFAYQAHRNALWELSSHFEKG